MKADPILIHYALELFEDEFISNSLLQCFFLIIRGMKCPIKYKKLCKR